jgi:predicted phosphodiesterase
MTTRGVLALISDTHLYRAGLPLFFDFLEGCRVERLACLGDCEPEPFQRWLEERPGREVYWVYDIFWPDLPEATAHGMTVALEGRIFLAHTRATAFIQFREPLAAYKTAPAAGRPPLLVCHGHTHTPSITRFGHSLNQILYINSATRHREQSRHELLHLAHDTVYLIVPGAFTLEEGRYPNFNFSLIDLENHLVEMFSLVHLQEFGTLRSALGVVPGPGYLYGAH